MTGMYGPCIKVLYENKKVIFVKIPKRIQIQKKSEVD